MEYIYFSYIENNGRNSYKEDKKEHQDEKNNNTPLISKLNTYSWL